MRARFMVCNESLRPIYYFGSIALRRTLARWTRNGTLGAAHFKLMLGTQDAAKADTQDAVGTRQTEGNATQDAGATTGGLQHKR